MKALVEQEDLLVLVAAQPVGGTVLLLLIGQLFFSLLVRSLYDKLILEVLACTSDTGSGVFEDEFRVTFW